MNRLGASEVFAQSAAQSIDWLAIAPAVAVAATALIVLIVDLWLPKGSVGPLTVLSLLGVAVALAAVIALWGDTRGTFCLPPLGDAGLPSCSYVVNPLTLVFQAIALGGAGVVILLAAAEVRDVRLPAGEFHFLLLASVAGAVTLAAARDLATLVVALEVLSLPGFALVGLRRQDVRSGEAALTFFLVSVVSVAVMLYGVSLIYGATGSLHLDRISAALSDPEVRTPATTVGVLLTIVGFAFKVAAVPFHFWVPDTYSGAPVTVAAYLSVVSKAGGIVGLVVVVSQGFGPYADVWGPVIAVLAALTMTIGNVGALMQRHAVRLLAWSSVAQAGFMLVPLGVASADLPGARLGNALSATVAYIAIYAVVNLGAFGVVAIVARDRPANRIEDYRGLIRTEPLSALALGFFLLNLAGLPPGIAGLWAKIVVIQSAVDGGVGWLAVVAAINTVIGLAYYLRFTAVLFAPARVGEPAPSYIVPTASGIAVGLVLAGGLLLSVLPQVVLQIVPGQAGLLG